MSSSGKCAQTSATCWLRHIQSLGPITVSYVHIGGETPVVSYETSDVTDLRVVVEGGAVLVLQVLASRREEGEREKELMARL